MAWEDTDRIGLLLERVLGLLENCLAETPGGEVATFLHQTTPPDDCCDLLAVWANRVYFTDSASFPNSKERPWAGCSENVLAVEIGLTLSRSCWPAITNEAFPAPSAMTAMAKVLAEDAMAMWCCLLDAQRHGLLTGTTAVNPVEYPVTFGDMMPYQDADCAGWDWTVVVAAEPCCVSTSS